MTNRGGHRSHLWQQVPGIVQPRLAQPDGPRAVEKLLLRVGRGVEAAAQLLRSHVQELVVLPGRSCCTGWDT